MCFWKLAGNQSAHVEILFSPHLSSLSDRGNSYRPGLRLTFTQILEFHILNLLLEYTSWCSPNLAKPTLVSPHLTTFEEKRCQIFSRLAATLLQSFHSLQDKTNCCVFIYLQSKALHVMIALNMFSMFQVDIRHTQHIASLRLYPAA